MWLGAADGRDTHIVIFQRVDLLNEPLDYLLFVEPLGVRKAAGLCSLAAARPAYPTPARHGPPTQTHIDHVLSQLGPLHTSEEAQQQVHDGRGADVLQQQVHKVILLPQEGHQLVCLAVDEDAHDLAEEAGQQRVEAAIALQEAIEPVQQGLIRSQGIVDLGHV